MGSETRTMRAVAQRSLKLSLAATGRHMSISRVSCAATVLRVPRLQPFGMPARTLCSGADISKTTLIDIYNEIGNEARQVMLQAEDSIRKEVDSKLAQGMGMDLAASMYGHQMATYMAEFLPLSERTDSVVQRIRTAVISKQKVSETQVDTAFKVFEKDHEVQLVLQTMYQHKLDEAVLPEALNLDKYIHLTEELGRIAVASVNALNKNISGKSSAYMTDNQKKEMDNARQAVPTTKRRRCHVQGQTARRPNVCCVATGSASERSTAATDSRRANEPRHRNAIRVHVLQFSVNQI